MIHHLQCSVFDSYASIIAHQVNCLGVMGSGVAAQVKRKYPAAYRSYLEYCNEHSHYRIGMLGHTQLCPVSFNHDGSPRIYVANLFGQYEYGYDKTFIYTNYVALRSCLTELADFAKIDNRIIAIPYKMGCARGGGDWGGVVFPMIKKILADCEVLICEYNKG